MAIATHKRLVELSSAELGFDPDSLREKYRQEREKRLKPEGNEQYIETGGEFSHYVDDPYASPGFTREALDEEVDVLIVGGGFGGLIAAARLREAGLHNFRIVEKASDFGGAWYWNRYPGVQCDIDAYIYLPLLEETGYIPKEKYSYGPEIFQHAQRIGRHFELYPVALFQTQVSGAQWDESAGRWIVTTDRNDRIRARHVVMSGGPLNRPKLPGISGIQKFKGHTFHTSRWDYEYTGGNTEGGLHKLSDKRVAVIGTGATAIQAVPHLGQYAQHLYVVQRTPSSVDARGNRPTDPEWVKTLTPGWQRRRMDNFNTIACGAQASEDLVQDGWTDLFLNLTQEDFAGSPHELMQAIELADFKKMNQIRERTASIVSKPDTADALKPWYRQTCKRPAFNDGYLPTFNRPNVTLVDTDGKGVERLTENALVVNGVEYEVDCIVFATGFEVGTSQSRKAGFEIVGSGGKTLSEHFSEGPRTLHGYYSHGFPNFFHLGISQNGYKVNFIDMLEEQVGHVVKVLSHLKQHNATRIEPTAKAEAAWVKTIRDKSEVFAAFVAECTPGYYNGEGGDVRKGLLVECYGGGAGSLEFTELMASWYADGRMKGLDIR
ncbi:MULTISPECIES: NAD(P)/FAD-dependent oxidoreductase [unclassified Pseudomonas]|uniref:flavin-containing monooxygenase n=1 Tax=unclassified Pseudomonas TaxID=196821 RepID=UPI00245898C8|nr:MULTISPECIES: NAD(P)/FAD-dependent oxidoreductase [unclassified Pseudomonas]MDH4561232.1 NAD(P)/FAD-dependent oxidoreductase [Pseudomonas sp. BN411]MDH4656960.1 NAD(P)/FAD-dependent oxidoreductase [Pseudomonas sp. BN606]